MEEVLELKETLEQERLVEWNQFPDIGLYMDQILSYMSRQMLYYNEEDRLTSAMVNNYIKAGLLPHAEKKKYTRAHLAYLTAICSLKQIIPVNDINLLLKQEMKDCSPEQFYEKFCTILNESLTEVSEEVNPEMEFEEIPEAAFRLAVSSYAAKLACARMIAIVRSKTEVEPPVNPKKADKKKDKKEKAYSSVKTSEDI